MLRGAILVGALALIVVSVSSSATTAQTTKPPNIVVILTDDQPIGTLSGMANVSALAAGGAKFNNAIISNPLCCPSRTTILTGLYSHDNGVYTNGDGRNDPDGGYPAFVANGNENRTFPLALQQAGYRTGLFGKYLNHYDGTTQPGWNAFHSFVGSNGSYYNYDWTVNFATPVLHGSDPADYSTDVAGSEANAWLGSLDPAQPFLLYFAPFAPHGKITPAPSDVGATTTTSFATPAYNEADVADKPQYIRDQPLFASSAAATFATRWNAQYATLLSADRWIGTLRATLQAAGTLDDTYFVFLSDNGLAWGDHRWNYKDVPYERSIRVPMIIDGPGVAHRGVGQVVSNVDLAPTILDLAGVAPMQTDGTSLAGVLQGATLGRPGVLLEHEYHGSKHAVPSFCGFRTKRFMFARYDEGGGGVEEELYNLGVDPYELTNIAAKNVTKATELRTATYAAGCDPAMVTPPPT
jgi:N-acetylglucosamine-6-sulfatase